MNPASAEKNEQNKAVVEADAGYSVAFTQIAGLLARRIVFRPKPGARLERGERVGLIKFGSRVDVLLPGNAELHVKKGDRVKGGATILATVPSAAVMSEIEEVFAEPIA
jgi:phosphatidylserine decarboxylase